MNGELSQNQGFGIIWIFRIPTMGEREKIKKISIESSYAIQKLLFEFLMKETKPIFTAKKFETLEDSKLIAFFGNFRFSNC